jgi:hypothetical protein
MVDLRVSLRQRRRRRVEQHRDLELVQGGEQPIGLTNIADRADKTGSGYPQLAGEYVIASNPDLIVVFSDTKCRAQTPQTVAAPFRSTTTSPRAGGRASYAVVLRVALSRSGLNPREAARRVGEARLRRGPRR